MCDICSDLLDLIRNYDAQDHSHKISKQDIIVVIKYTEKWPHNRSCLCCYNDDENFESFNNIVQSIIALSINFISSLIPPELVRDKHLDDAPPPLLSVNQIAYDKPLEESENTQCLLPKSDPSDEALKKSKPDGSSRVLLVIKSGVLDSAAADKRTDEISVDSRDAGGVSGAALEADQSEEEVDVTGLELEQTANTCQLPASSPVLEEMISSPMFDFTPPQSPTVDPLMDWTLDERNTLLQFVSRIFLSSFPLYLAHKHKSPNAIESLTRRELEALSNYCELNDQDAMLYLLQNVCYFCDSNGMEALLRSFKNATLNTLPCHVAHTLIVLCSNLRTWMNSRSVSRLIMPIRNAAIAYIMQFEEKDLRLPLSRNMTDNIWQILKNQLLDLPGLSLALKYFSASMLTLRLFAINHINNQINVISTCGEGEMGGVLEDDSIASQLCEWIVENKLVEQIFGPNLHIEIIKQSQYIVNFLAAECRITNEHINVIWSASQLKHCGKHVLELLTIMVKHLDLVPVEHLYYLLTKLDMTSHTEQTLLLASALVKCLWMTATSHQTLVSMTTQYHRGNQPIMMMQSGNQNCSSVSHSSPDLVPVKLTPQELVGCYTHSSDDDEDDDEEDDNDEGSDAGEGVDQMSMEIGEEDLKALQNQPIITQWDIPSSNQLRLRSSSTEGQRSDDGNISGERNPSSPVDDNLLLRDITKKVLRKKISPLGKALKEIIVKDKFETLKQMQLISKLQQHQHSKHQPADSETDSEDEEEPNNEEPKKKKVPTATLR